MGRLFVIFGAPSVLLWRTFKAARRHGVPGREVMVQFVELGSKTGWLIATGLGFFGTVAVSIAYAQAKKYLGNITIAGPAYFELMVREFAPIAAAMLGAARVGAGTSAELAAMSVNEQVEALELSAGDPLAELVAPRVLAGLLAMPVLMVIGVVAGCVSAAATVTYRFGADGSAFLDPRFLDPGDFACAAAKAVLCGLFIPAAAAYRGLKAKGGAGAVGEAVTAGVVDACMGCLMIDFLVAAVFFVFDV